MRHRGTTLIFLVLDAIFFNCAYFGALLFRFNNIPFIYLHSWLILAPGATVLALLSYRFFGLYRRLWQYASIGELYAILGGVTVGNLLAVVLSYLFIYPPIQIPLFPRSVFIVAWLLNFIFVGASRFYLRSASHLRGASPNVKRKKRLEGEVEVQKRVLIVGAGDAGAVVVRELRRHPSLGVKPVGFIDDDLNKTGLYLLDVPVLGARDDIPRIVDKENVDEVIIAMPSAPGSIIREIVGICNNKGVRLKTLPGVYELIDGKVRVDQIRDVQVEDLLGREPVQLDLNEMAGFIEDKVVLVTGAGGSIGSELCRQIARFTPSRLILLDKSENNLFEIEQELRDRHVDLDFPAELADVRDQGVVDQIFNGYRPQIIFHAAAYKHVPMMERFPQHAVSNNILGTYNVAVAAQTYGSEVFILVSTDKAVHPSSVMGASKRAAELIVQYFDQQGRRDRRPAATHYAAVRFGNVLGSSGSVLPTFKRQIAMGGPITVTHPEMIRYFMTIPEAVQLILQAGTLARGGEIFVLDMGEPVKIVDLARDLIRLSGLVPDEEIEIKFIGIRPGEKLREELFTLQEQRMATKNSRIFVTRDEEGDFQAAARMVAELRSGFSQLQPEQAIAILGSLFPGLECENSIKPGQPSVLVQDQIRISL
jgi:FlaA1/EpsC-like NDP-sugar epimerase